MQMFVCTQHPLAAQRILMDLVNYDLTENIGLSWFGTRINLYFQSGEWNRDKMLVNL